jgi:23S rRNA (cytosine1962-C5)-methyltransferase
MFSADQYELLDFGNGRKLERFGDCLLDRPAPAVEAVPVANPTLWEAAHATFRRSAKQDGKWSSCSLPAEWTITHGSVVVQLKRTEFGHVGLFPEQAANWDWVAKRVAAAPKPVKVLNLFAYTGGATLAAAAAGAQVVHVDSAQNVVAWARRNAELSGLSDSPIRWITEDATRFAKREVQRGNKYNAVILDPPSYGHGPKGEVWKLERHLLPLLQMCRELTEGQRVFILVTCHTPNFGPAELQAYLADAVFGSCQAGAHAKQLSIRGADGRELPSGTVARWP